MPAPPEVLELVRRFEENLGTYLTSYYNEAQVRLEFIDPLFRALGWDVGNQKGLSLVFREVVLEESLVVADSRTAPDYSFRIGGDRKFFVEAKRPSVNIGIDPDPAYQVRRYAWSAKLPVSVVTDFQEFALYDCRQEPSLTDDAAVARLMYFTFRELDERWDELESLLSYNAVRNGSLERYAESIVVKRGTTEVNSIFLLELQRWRAALAGDLASRNPGLTRRELNFAVQQTIDRIVFLRIAEARGIEEYGQLQSLLGSATIYEGLTVLLERADERYNSGLFHFRQEDDIPEEPDRLTLTLSVSNEVLAGIIRRLYYPESPYEFSVLPAAILGQVYEQFLGQVISLRPGHKAFVEDKPEVRHAGGVYYTPQPIVDFIIASTLTALVEGRSIQAVAGEGRSPGRHPARVLDPACGSGTFLLAAYEFMLRWYYNAYVTDNPERWATGRSPRLRRGVHGEWQLTTHERKQILLRHIYGVDIDPQAVEVTKLSLLLKVLEGESLEAIDAQIALFHERALPDLSSNIKSGNSLIEPDFYDNQQLSLLDGEATMEINVFDWQQEFTAVFSSAGGFDAVVGNPPYLDSETMTQYTPLWRPYCVSKYRSASGNWDVFCVFIERAIELCRDGGRHSFIVPNKLGSANYASAIRRIMASETTLEGVRDYASIPVFPVAVYPIIYCLTKQAPASTSPTLYERMRQNATGLAIVARNEELDRSRYFPADGSPWPIFADINIESPVERIRESFAQLGSAARVHGAATVAEAYDLAPLIEDKENPAPGDLRMVNSGTIDRYVGLWGIKRMRYLGSAFLHPVIPRKVQNQISANRLAQSHSPKIVIASMTKALECLVDLDGSLLAGKSTTVIQTDMDLCWLLGILNSRLMSFYYLSVYGGDRLQGGYLRIGPPQLRTLPIPEFNDSLLDRELSEHVRTLIELARRQHEASTPYERRALVRQISILESRINESVYQIYGVNDVERLVVEESLEPLS